MAPPSSATATSTSRVSLVERRATRFATFQVGTANWVEPMFRPHGVFFILVNFALLVLTLGLDVRDLYYKTTSIGPYDSYSFDGVGDHILDALNLVPTTPGNVSGQLLPRASGWSSFLEPCDAMSGTSFFLSSLGTNCSVGGARGDLHARIVPKLVMTGTIRVDSVAWACCQLLHYHKRPGLCHRRIAARFLKRYAIEAPQIPRQAMAAPGSLAEHELLLLLDVLSNSSRVNRIVCVEAFELRGAGLYNPTIFGCGSADNYAAAFAGLHTAHLAVLLQDKAWLTLDDLNVMRLRYVVRQNDRSDYIVRVESDGHTVATHHPYMNYSSSGLLYPIMIACEITIFLAQLSSSYQVARELLVPQLLFHLGRRARPVGFFTGSTWLSLVSRSLVRSTPIAALSALSQLVSWQLIMPNSVIWAWTDKSAGRWLALLSSMRVWELLLVLFVWLWEAVVALIGERAAYAITSRTFISLPEIIAIAALVGLLRRKDLLSVSNNKYAYDGQRLADFSSFVGAGGYSNAYNADHDRVRSSDAQYWAVVYGPLARLAAVSLAGFATLVVLKMVYYWPEQRRTESFAAASGRLDSVRLLPYERVPVELLLDEPIRAKSLLRFRFDMELSPTTGDARAGIPPIRYLYAPLYFAFGSLVDSHGDLVRRYGFIQAIPPCIDLSSGISVSDSVALTGSTLVLGGMAAGRPLSAAAGARRLTHRLTRGVSSSVVVAARRVSPRFMGHAASEPPRRRTGAGGDGTGVAPQWLSERWTGRRFSFNVPVH